MVQCVNLPSRVRFASMPVKRTQSRCFCSADEILMFNFNFNVNFCRLLLLYNIRRLFRDQHASSHIHKSIFGDKSFSAAVWNNLESTVFTALHGMQTRSSDDNSVSLSVCSSVRLSLYPSNACIVTKRKKDMSKFLYHTKDQRMTLNDLERRNSPYFTIFFTEFDRFSGW